MSLPHMWSPGKVLRACKYTSDDGVRGPALKDRRSGLWDARYNNEGQIWGAGPSPSCKRMLQDLRTSDLVIDAGFGYGRDIIFLVKEGYNVWGAEPSEEGVALASSALKQCGLFTRTRLLQGRFENIPLPRAHFNALLSHRTIHLLNSDEEVDAFAAQAARILRPEGKVYICARSLQDYNPQKMRWIVPGKEAVYMLAGREGHKISFWDESRFEKTFEKVGFVIEELSCIPEKESVGNSEQTSLLLMVARKSTACSARRVGA